MELRECSLVPRLSIGESRAAELLKLFVRRFAGWVGEAGAHAQMLAFNRPTATLPGAGAKPPPMRASTPQARGVRMREGRAYRSGARTGTGEG